MPKYNFNDRILIKTFSYYSIMTGDERYFISFREFDDPDDIYSRHTVRYFTDLETALSKYKDVLNGDKWKIVSTNSLDKREYEIIKRFTDDDFYNKFVEYLI